MIKCYIQFTPDKGAYKVKKNNYLSIRNKSVVKANELIQRSRFSLSLQQQKIVLYIIAQIKETDEDFKLYDFDIREFCATCGIDYGSGNNYAEIKQQVQEIRDKSLWVPLPDGRETTVSWIKKPYINPKSGTIQISLDEDMKPYLLQLKNNFTKYELVYTLYFKSKYTIRLYELVKSIHYNELETYERIYKTEELKKLLDAEIYTTYQHFREKVLEKAIAEINEHSDKIITYTPLKNCRTYDRIKITVSSKSIEETLRIRTAIDREMNYNSDQCSIFDD